MMQQALLYGNLQNNKELNKGNTIMEEKTNFIVDQNKCIGCGKCVNVCSGMVLSMDGGRPVMKPFERFGWRGCWRCQHCLAVCPQGAISIFRKRPEDSLPPPRLKWETIWLDWWSTAAPAGDIWIKCGPGDH